MSEKKGWGNWFKVLFGRGREKGPSAPEKPAKESEKIISKQKPYESTSEHATIGYKSREIVQETQFKADITLPRTGDIEATMIKPSVSDDTLPIESAGPEETMPTGSTLPQTYLQMDQKSLAEAEALVAEEWKVGDVILDLYEVKEVLGEGGFGKVHHRGWNTDIAVKSLRKDLAKDKVQRKIFIQECEGWVNLGLHPNIVSCYYVRDLGGFPRIFSELMDGGSLEDWLDGDKIEEWKQILDLAIQCLDGLSFSHDKGLIHRDIKPVNCLMSKAGDLKITDFGIASGLTGLGFDVTESKVMDVTKTMMFKEGAVGTPAYMPPEQWDRQYGEIGPWSDIYAFGVMLFEMCCKERPFDEGGEDIGVLKIRHTGVEPPKPKDIREDITEKLSDFILRCLKKKTDERFRNCDEARDELVRIYEEVIGERYLRERPKEVELLGDSLNNRALSLMDLGKIEDAEKILEMAIKTDPTHLQLIFNQKLLYWRSGKITDITLIEQLKGLKKIRSQDWMIGYLLGLVHIERGDGASAVEELEKSLKQLKETEQQSVEVEKALLKAKEGLNKWGRCLKTFDEYTGYAEPICFSPDLRYVLSGRGLEKYGKDDNNLHLWKVGSVLEPLKVIHLQ